MLHFNLFGSNKLHRKVSTGILFFVLFFSVFVPVLFTLIPQVKATSNIFTISQSGNVYTYTPNVGSPQNNVTNYAQTLINTAISAASAYSNGVVQILTGNYWLSASIVPQSNCEVNCSSGVTIYQSPLTSLASSVSLVLTTSSTNNFIWNGGVLNGNKGSLSDFRSTTTWAPNFYNYFGIGFYGGTDSNITIENVVIKNVIGQGIDLYATSQGWCNNDTVIYAGDNPITIDIGCSNSTVENCYVNGAQDVGINTFQSTNCVLRNNTVFNATCVLFGSNYSSGWEMATENSNNISIYNNNITAVSGGQDTFVSTSSNTLIANNLINGVGTSGVGIHLESGATNNIVQNNTLTNCNQYQSIGVDETGAILINNTVVNGDYVGVESSNTTISGGSINVPSDANGCINIGGVSNITVRNVTLSGADGIMGTVTNLNFEYNNFTGISGTNVGVTGTNITYAYNIGYGLGPSNPSIYGSSSGWETSSSDITDGGIWTANYGSGATTTIQVESSVVYSGAYSVEFSTSAKDNGAWLSTATPSVNYISVAFALRVSALPNYATQTFLYIGNFDFGITAPASTSYWYVGYNYPTGGSTDSSSSPVANNWYYINVTADIATSGYYTVSINGTQVIDVTGNTLSEGALNGVAIGLFGYEGYAPVNAYFDSVSASGSMNYLTIQSATGGTTTPSTGTYPYTGNAEVTATPNNGYAFLYWNVGGSMYPDLSNPVYIPMSSNQTIQPVFYLLLLTFYINATTQTGGTISPSGLVPVTQGNNQQFIYSANSGYTLSEILVDSSDVGIANYPSSYFFSDVQENHTISLVLTNPSPTPTPPPSSGGGGSGSPFYPNLIISPPPTSIIPPGTLKTPLGNFAYADLFWVVLAVIIASVVLLYAYAPKNKGGKSLAAMFEERKRRGD